MRRVHCQFGSFVQDAAEKALPGWCTAEACPHRTSAECYWTLRAAGIDAMPKADEEMLLKAQKSSI